MHAWVALARLERAKTLSGGLVARSVPGLSFLLYPGLEVAFVPPRHDVLRRAVVKSVCCEGGGVYLTTFEGVDSIDVAASLVGCLCLARRCDVKLDGAPAKVDNLVGYEIYDAHAGLVGVVSDTRINVAQLLLVVECPQKAKEVLVPLIDEFVVHLDADARRIDVVLPEGLLDL